MLTKKSAVKKSNGFLTLALPTAPLVRTIELDSIVSHLLPVFFIYTC
ncbi:hypothetical protein HMPREF9065_02150 [Aggregatibacter sp. oral taxon 458 str. W10330]|nr:hypothetical protein HMPREF9065_02150 [Aggregatibacter sp. oral taxon 458 str. W10330]